MSRSFLRQDRMNGYRVNRTREKDLDAWIIKNRVVRNWEQNQLYLAQHNKLCIIQHNKLYITQHEAMYNTR